MDCGTPKEQARNGSPVQPRGAKHKEAQCKCRRRYPATCQLAENGSQPRLVAAEHGHGGGWRGRPLLLISCLQSTRSFLDCKPIGAVPDAAVSWVAQVQGPARVGLVFLVTSLDHSGVFPTPCAYGGAWGNTWFS